MIEVKENKFLTITCTAGEVYFIDYSSGSEIDVINHTDNDIYLGSGEEFTTTSNVSNYAIINSEGYYNGIRTSSGIYIKAVGSGDITLIRYY